MQNPADTFKPGLEGKIAFVSRGKKGDYEICVMQANGANRKNLATFPWEEAISFLVWSPDGQKIAFTSHRTGNHEIYVMNVDGSDQQQLTDSRTTTYGAAWSPDGKSIAFTSVWPETEEVYVMNADGSGIKRLTETAYIEDGDAKAWNRNPAWSPDGRQIAFLSARSGDPQIHIMNADGSAPRQVTESGGMKDYPTWSPDGKRIAFEWNNVIAVIDTVGANLRQLTMDTGWFDTHPTWSPDGQYIAYQSQVGVDRQARPLKIGHSEIFVVNVEATRTIRLTTTNTDNACPSWIR